MERVRIAVLDAYDNVLAFMDNGAPKALHYYEDELHEYLKGTANTLTFCAGAKHEDAQYLVEGNKLSFLYRGKEYYLNIMNVRRDELEVEVTAYSLSFELLNEEKEKYAATEAKTFAQYLEIFDAEHIITLGNNEVSDKSIKYEWKGSSTLLARLFSLATVFNAEVEFVPALNDNYSLKEIRMNVYKEHSDTIQGIGVNRNDITLRYGKNVTGITKTSDITGLYTAIRPFGRDGLTITELDKAEYNADGNLEYSSPAGNNNILAPQARDRFPSNLWSANDRYIAKIYEYDTDNVNVLYGNALSELKKNCVPKVEYKVSGYFDTDIGDTVQIEDDEYNPALYLEARVTEQIRSFTDLTRNKTTFDNFHELQSQLDSDLVAKMNALIEQNKTYTCMISTNNGTTFKNNTGSTTLTASVRDGVTDVTDKFTIVWRKDGTELATGKSITVNAADVDGKALYRFDAKDSGGNIKGFYEVTVADVSDGKNGEKGDPGDKGDTGEKGEKGDKGDKGDPGKDGLDGLQGEKGDQGIPGKDGTSSYTHIAYANSADGHTDFSVSDSDRKYIGMYVDDQLTDSENPDDYRWTLVKGQDGANGTPGKAGEDGRTPYIHIAYANSADGQTDFSVTESDGKSYIGQYTDYEEPDSTDPNNYAWSKIKGDDGADGKDGTSSYTHIKYSDDGKTFTPVPNYVSKNRMDWLKGYYGSGSTTAEENPNKTAVYNNICMSKVFDVNDSEEYRAASGNEKVSFRFTLYKNGTYYKLFDPNTDVFKFESGVNAVRVYLNCLDSSVVSSIESWDVLFENGEIAPEFSRTSEQIGDTPGAWMGQMTSTDPEPSLVFSDYTWKKIEGDPTGIVESADEPSDKYVGMLWKNTGTTSGLVQGATYRWNGTEWEMYKFSATNIEAETFRGYLFSGAIYESEFNDDVSPYLRYTGKMRIESGTMTIDTTKYTRATQEGEWQAGVSQNITLSYEGIKMSESKQGSETSEELVLSFDNLKKLLALI